MKRNMPFFDRFISSQKKLIKPIRPGSPINTSVTEKYPSDSDEDVMTTKKYPSDNDEDMAVTMKYPSDSDEV